MQFVNKLIILLVVIQLIIAGTNQFATVNAASNDVAIHPDLKAKLSDIPFPDALEGKPPRFNYLRKLLEISSGAKQVMQSSNIEAHQAYIAARTTYLAAANETETDKINALLDQAVKEMYLAIRLASPKELINRKKERDYKQRLLSVNALIEALERIAIEKNKVDDTNKLKVHVNELIQSADLLVKKKKLDDARVQLDEAYLLIKTGIENMRSGDTLVRDLNFASKEEEYTYELDRNDTHQMLIKMLVEKRLASKPESYRKRILDKVEIAKELRSKAELEAESGNFEAGITELENSTRELVKAIRMGGVFIPG